jgi:cytochrome c oxidase subunit 2
MVLQASSYAGSIDGIIMLILVLVGFWFILAEGMFFYLIWRFREKPGQKSEYITGKEKKIKRWVTIPHALVLVCDVFIIIGAINVWYDVKQHLPEADYTVRIIGQQWAWV